MPLPPIEQRTFTAVYERALAQRPDEIAQIDLHGTFDLPEGYSRACDRIRRRSPVSCASLLP
jgi:hypothetical protein